MTTLYLTICGFTFLSFVGALVRCLNIVERYNIELKPSSKSKVSLYIELFLTVIMPIIHLIFLLGFVVVLFLLSDEELKKVLVEASNK